MYYKRILTFMFPVLYSPNETVYFLGFFTSRIRIRICPCGADPDPKHCFQPVDPDPNSFSLLGPDLKNQGGKN